MPANDAERAELGSNGGRVEGQARSGMADREHKHDNQQGQPWKGVHVCFNDRLIEPNWKPLGLVEMLVERGARRVVSFDVVPKPADAWEHPAIEWRVGDITDKAALAAALVGIDCVWHNAAAVGPFHPKDLYYKVNYVGTLNVIECCKAAGVSRVVMSSSPSTRFTGGDVDGLTEAQMPALPLRKYLQPYAETKAMGEMAMMAACTDAFMTVAVAPHQVYGPRDNLFLPNMLEAAGTGRLRVFGGGGNRICFTHVDNYCHGLVLAAAALQPGAPVLGKFYIVTDGNTHPHPQGHLQFWRVLDEAVVGMGFTSIWSKMKLPYALLLVLAWVCELVGWLLGTTLKLNVFNVYVLTMHRWFNIDAAQRDLGYAPIVRYADGWADTIVWFRAHWLPRFTTPAVGSVLGLSAQSQAKIDIQAGSAAAVGRPGGGAAASGRGKQGKGA